MAQEVFGIQIKAFKQKCFVACFLEFFVFPVFDFNPKARNKRQTFICDTSRYFFHFISA